MWNAASVIMRMRTGVGGNMVAGELQALESPARRPLSAAVFVLCLIFVVGITAGVVASPLIMQKFYVDGRDYSTISNVGQAYGGASAVVSCIALLAVTISMFIQHQQVRVMRHDAHAEFNEDLVLLAMQYPKYRQCWGARVSADGVDEDLFYYCSKVIKGWRRSWELKKVDEAQVREYLRNWFDSEIPRLFWEAHGDWHRSGAAQPHRDRFREFVNSEYLRAVKAGPPARRYQVTVDN